MDHEEATARLSAKLLQAPVIMVGGLQHGDTHRSRHDSRLSTFSTPKLPLRALF